MGLLLQMLRYSCFYRGILTFYKILFSFHVSCMICPSCTIGVYLYDQCNLHNQFTKNSINIGYLKKWYVCILDPTEQRSLDPVLHLPLKSIIITDYGASYAFNEPVFIDFFRELLSPPSFICNSYFQGYLQLGL